MFKKHHNAGCRVAIESPGMDRTMRIAAVPAEHPKGQSMGLIATGKKDRMPLLLQQLPRRRLSRYLQSAPQQSTRLTSVQSLLCLAMAWNRFGLLQ
jgi:hypothetical protein